MRKARALRYRPADDGMGCLGRRLRTAAPAPERVARKPALDAIDKDIRAGVYGDVDRLYVIRKSEVLVDRSFPRDYRAISRGRVGPIGCGDGCADATWTHEFNRAVSAAERAGVEPR